MHTSILVLALAGFGPASEAVNVPAWTTNYGAAKKTAADTGKPLAVVFGAGLKGWQKLDRDGDLSTDVSHILSDQYICVHIDTATERGLALASAFDMPGGLGIVISDHTGALQAFRHEGDLDDEALARHLQRYADPSHVVRTTESNPAPVERSSYYYAPPVFYAPSFSSGCST
jgi:hypothetical protein